MLKIKKMPKLLTDLEIKRLNALSTPPICDALGKLNITMGGCLSHTIKSVSKKRKMVGVAYTVLAKDGNSFPLHYAVYNSGAGYILAVDTGRFDQGPYMGELMVKTAEYMGINGLLIDGYVRDAELLEQMDYPVFCKGFIPRQPEKNDQGELNGSINCGGVIIMPGDAIVADADGVVIIPRKYLVEVLDAAEAKEFLDTQRRDQIEKFFENNIGNVCNKNLQHIMSKDVLKLISCTTTV